MTVVDEPQIQTPPKHSFDDPAVREKAKLAREAAMKRRKSLKDVQDSLAEMNDALNAMQQDHPVELMPPDILTLVRACQIALTLSVK